MNREKLSKINKSLLFAGQEVKSEALFPVLVPGAADLLFTDPYAFAIAVCLDRGTKAQIIWTIPYDIKCHLGHLDPLKIYQMTQAELFDLFNHLPRRPRYINDAPRTIRDLTRIVIEEFGGDAAKIWTDKNSWEVKRTFQSIHGVGQGIANMSVLLIEKAFKVRFSDPEHRQMDIKPDVHTRRVLFRLGVCSEETEIAAVEGARLLNPVYPGAVDLALWEVGRNYCHASNPNCSICLLNIDCEKISL